MAYTPAGDFRVDRLEYDTGQGCAWRITLQPYHWTGQRRPQAIDLPPFVREALRAWLDEADR